MFGVASLALLLFQGFTSSVLVPMKMTAPLTTLNITAITANSRRMSTLECWQLSAPFKHAPGVSPLVGFAPLGELGSATLAVGPPNFAAALGLHNAPAVQYVRSSAATYVYTIISRLIPAYFRFVHFINDRITISFPNSSETATFDGGIHGLVIATDTSDVSDYGHYTEVTGNETSMSLFLPTLNNVIPPHKVLHTGPCDLEKEESF